MHLSKKVKTFLSFLGLLFSISTMSQDTLKVLNVEAILYTGQGKNQPLIVGFGGSEGGNAWALDYWKKTRNAFIEKGYSFLAVGYFGCEGTPKILDKIAIDEVYLAIAEAKKNKKINPHKIAVLGGSRGADLALLLGSYYPDITCVVGMSASNAVFPGHTQTFNSSCWTYAEKELPFIPINEEAIPFLMKRDLRGTFEAMLKDSVAEQSALIQIEKIKGAVLLLSATNDEIIPAVDMGEKMMAMLKSKHFRHKYEHIILDGNHAETSKHFEKIFDFLELNFINKSVQ